MICLMKCSNENMQKERVNWIDASKCIGIFLIYIAHLGKDAGHIYLFAYKFHVALFFFLSGCSHYFEHQMSFKEYAKRKIKSIIIPFYVFSILSTILYAIINDSSISNIKLLLLEIGKGCIRNSSFPAVSLWFLTCLFVIEISFKAVSKIPQIVRIPLIIFVFWGQLLYYNGPRVPYNIDSIHFILYFALGYDSVPIINILNKRAILRAACLFISGIFATLEFLGFDIIDKLLITNRTVLLFSSAIRTLVLILFIVLISKAVEEIRIFQNIGKNTLYLCGLEYIIKETTVELASLLNLKITFTDPYACYIYSIFVIILGVYVFTPALKNTFKLVFIPGKG